MLGLLTVQQSTHQRRVRHPALEGQAEERVDVIGRARLPYVELSPVLARRASSRESSTVSSSDKRPPSPDLAVKSLLPERRSDGAHRAIALVAADPAGMNSLAFSRTPDSRRKAGLGPPGRSRNPDGGHEDVSGVARDGTRLERLAERVDCILGPLAGQVHGSDEFEFVRGEGVCAEAFVDLERTLSAFAGGREAPLTELDLGKVELRPLQPWPHCPSLRKTARRPREAIELGRAGRAS